MTVRVKTIITSSAAQTRKRGSELAKKLLKIKTRRSCTVALIGDLGAGKTTFLQGFAKGLSIKEKVLSPTFFLVKHFKIPQNKKEGCGDYFHIDCYRIKKQKELVDLGFKEIIENPCHIVAIEWADRIRKLLPANTIFIHFTVLDQKRRQIVIQYQKQ